MPDRLPACLPARVSTLTWPGVHFSLRATKAIIFVVVAQFLLIYIDEMCVTTTRNEEREMRTRTRTRATMAITITITGSFVARRLCLLSYHAQLDNFHLLCTHPTWSRPGAGRRRDRVETFTWSLIRTEPGRVFTSFSFSVFFLGFSFWLLIELRWHWQWG